MLKYFLNRYIGNNFTYFFKHFSFSGCITVILACRAKYADVLAYRVKYAEVLTCRTKNAEELTCRTKYAEI